MLWALEEFYLSMLGINIAVGDRTAWPAAFPQRLLVIDEFGTFAGMATRDHRRHGHAGPPPALDQRRQLEWQGRQANHRLLVAVHQPNLRLFEDSDSRAQYGYRLITGAYSTSLWRMTFGYAPPVEWDARIKGRGAVGIGESTLADPSRADHPPARRRYALTGPPPPDWHASGQPAPWITGRVITEGRKLAGTSLISAPGPSVPVPPGQHIPPPAETPAAVPPWDTPAAEPAAPTEPAMDLAVTAAQVTGGDGERLVVGITEAARYLGYDKPDSFRRARTRRPIVGETRMSDGRPAWAAGVLQAWRSAQVQGRASAKDP